MIGAAAELFNKFVDLARVGRRTGATELPMTVVGRHCEAGDVIAPDVPLPADVRAA